MTTLNKDSSAQNHYLFQPYEDKKNKKFGILAFNFTNSEVNEVQTEFNVHNLFFNKESNEFIGINKYGPRYLKFSGVAFEKLQYFSIDEKSFTLAGHASSVSFDPNYYLTGATYDGLSVIISIDKKTNVSSVCADLGPSNPPAHDCKFSSDSKNLLVTNFNKIHSYNVHTRKLASQSFPLISPLSSFRHFSTNHKNEIVVQSNIIHTKNDYVYESAQICFSSGHKFETSLASKIDPRIKDNDLQDFSFDTTGNLFACVHGMTSLLTIWKTHPLQFVKMIDFKECIVRVANYFDKPSFLIVGTENIFVLDTVYFNISKVNKFSKVFKSDYSHSHKTLVSI